MIKKILNSTFLIASITLGILAFSLAELVFANEDPDTKSFTFVQLCDPQLGMGGYQHDVKSFELAVEQINALRPDFVVICGDLVDTPNAESFADFNRIRAGLTVPCYCAPGNHDVGNIATLASLVRYRKVIGEDYYSFENKGYTFVIANSQLWKAPMVGESKKHDAWFKRTLEAAHEKDSPVLVVMHYPLYVKDPEEAEGYFNLPVQKRKELLALFGRYGVVAALAGHTHRTIINEYRGIQFVNGEATSKNFDERPLGFRLWHVSPSLIRHKFIPLQPLNDKPGAVAVPD